MEEWSGEAEEWRRSGGVEEWRSVTESKVFQSPECDGVLDRSRRTEVTAEGLKYNCPESGDSKSTKSEV